MTAPPAAPPRARACGVCGAPAGPPYRAPPPELAPDLDLRPGEPTRGTLRRWVATCRGCGAVAPDLVALPRTARAVVDSTDYRALSGPAAPFLRWAMLCADDPAAAAGAMLQAAWALDDAGQDAAAPRRRAALLWGEGATVQDGLCAVDALRRAGDLALAGARAAALLARPDTAETDRLVLHYQQRLIASGDVGRHLMSSALRPPAQRPHVTHGRPPATRSLWQRLAGR